LTQIQLILNGSSFLNLLIDADYDYVIKAIEAIKNTMLDSPADHAIKTIEFLNANNAILSKINTQLITTSWARN
jgi:hypothetical protein